MENLVSKTQQVIKKISLALPHVESGIACQGTSLECTTFSVKKKTFVFLRAVGNACEVRMKLGGKWEKKLVPLEDPPVQLEKWLHESYAALASRPARKKTAQK
jgi:hypothetical protein